jgi:hypothetical protein
LDVDTVQTGASNEVGSEVGALNSEHVGSSPECVQMRDIKRGQRLAGHVELFKYLEMKETTQNLIEGGKLSGGG